MSSMMRSDAAIPICTMLNEKSETNVANRKVPNNPMKLTTRPRLRTPERHNSRPCKSAPPQHSANTNIGQ